MLLCCVWREDWQHQKYVISTNISGVCKMPLFTYTSVSVPKKMARVQPFSASSKKIPVEDSVKKKKPTKN